MICVYSVKNRGNCVSKNGKSETQINLCLFYETQNVFWDAFYRFLSNKSDLDKKIALQIYLNGDTE